MPFLTVFLTCPFVLFAFYKKHETEEYYLIKLFGIWLLSLIYITLNSSLRIPLGTMCAIFIVYKTKINKVPKLTSLIIGIISLLSSSIVYLITKV